MGATLRWMQQAQPENHPSRAHPAPLAFTHHPLLQPPHSQLQTQLIHHPHQYHPAYGCDG